MQRSLETTRSQDYVMEAVGQNAGQVWKYLYDNGETSVLKIKTELGITSGAVHMALGWLMREDKIEFEFGSGYPVVRLKREKSEIV